MPTVRSGVIDMPMVSCLSNTLSNLRRCSIDSVTADCHSFFTLPEVSSPVLEGIALLYTLIPRDLSMCYMNQVFGMLG